MKCLHCGSEFNPARKTAKFCSTKCRVQAGRGNTVTLSQDVTLTERPVTLTENTCKFGTCLKADCPFRGKVQKVNTETDFSPQCCPKCKGLTTLSGMCVADCFETTAPVTEWTNHCVRCGQIYTSPLELMRFCSDACKREAIVVIANGPHKLFTA